MKLTIVTPTLNAADVIEEAILSVRHQQFKDHEHLIIDSRSTDGTLEILKKYPEIRVVSEADSGIYDAMNKAIELAKGEWIYFLGADDSFYSNDILNHVSQELTDPFDVVYGDVISDRFHGRYGGVFDYQQIFYKNICHQAVFFRRRVFDRIGLFNTQYQMLSDWDHNMRWVLDPNIKSKHIDLIIANYADGGLSSTSFDTQFHRDRRFNYLRYGHKVMPTLQAYKMLADEIRENVKLKNIRRVLACLGLGLSIGVRLIVSRK